MSNNRKQETRDRILEAALEVFAEKGYHETNVDDIVNASNTSKGGFYFHFPSKRKIFLTLIDEMGKILVEKIEAEAKTGRTAKEKASLALKKGLRIFTKYRDLAKFLLIEAFATGQAFEEERKKIHENLEKIFQSNLEEAKEENTISSSVDTALIASLWVGAINHIVIKFLLNETRNKTNIETDQLEQSLFSMVGWDKR